MALARRLTRPIVRGLGRGTGETPELVSNGSFADATGWTAGGGWSIGSGVATAASSGSLTRSIAVLPGRWYRVTYEITAYTTGIVTPSLSGGTTVMGAQATGVGLKSTLIQAVTGNVNLGFVASGSPSLSIDNVSVKLAA